MSISGVRMFLLGAGFTAAISAALFLTLGRSKAPYAEAHFPHPGIDFSLRIGGQCDSTAGPTVCNVGQRFTLEWRVNSIPAVFSYEGYDSNVNYSAGLSPDLPALVQQGPGVWPQCGTTVVYSQPGVIAPACAVALPPLPESSTYTGPMWHVDFTCLPGAATETLTMLSLLPGGSPGTDLVGALDHALHGEASNETLTINCFSPTPTPSGPSELDITAIGIYRPPLSCYHVLDSNTQAVLFDVCDNDFKGAPVHNALCIPDGICNDEDPAIGLLKVSLAPGHYHLIESVAPPFHATDPRSLDCDTTNTNSCQVVVFDAPVTRPWFPWDVTGDGKVRIDDVVDLIAHYREDVPPGQ